MPPMSRRRDLLHRGFGCDIGIRFALPPLSAYQSATYSDRLRSAFRSPRMGIIEFRLA
jgi:hypothetical protein